MRPEYQPPVATETEEEALARKAREPVRTAIFAVLFVLVLVAGAIIGPMFGLLGGLAFAILAGSVLTGLYKLTSRAPKALSSANTAGATACPNCGSMQTDQDYTRGPNGTEVLRWTCYNCDHRWLAH